MYFVLYTASYGLRCGTQSSIAQDRLGSFALFHIGNEAARELDLDELVDTFANIKARKKRVLSSD